MNRNMRRPVTGALALAALMLAATTALPAFAATSAPLAASLRDAAATPVETVQNRTQAQRQRQRQRTTRTYRGYNSYAADPRVRGSYGSQGYSNPWGHCVRIGEHTPGRGAFPDWDIC